MRLTEPRPVRRAAPRPRPFVLLAVQLACLSLPVLSQQRPDAPPPNMVDEVRLTVTVTDGKGRFVAGLGKEHFAVSVGKKPREVSFFDDKDVPMSVGFLFDVSGSVESGRIRAARLAVGRFIQMSHPDTEYFLSEFGSQSRPLTDWTREAAQLVDGIRQAGTRRGGNTALYDACAAALEKAASGRHAKRVLILISDGGDNTSKISFNELRRRVQASDVLIYGIVLNERSLVGATNLSGLTGVLILDELAAQSGGTALSAESEDDVVFVAERVAVELRHQYTIGFRAGEVEAKGPKLTKVKVKATPPSKFVKGVVTRSREGYFSPRAKS